MIASIFRIPFFIVEYSTLKTAINHHLDFLHPREISARKISQLRPLQNDAVITRYNGEKMSVKGSCITGWTGRAHSA